MKRWLALVVGTICWCGCDRAPSPPPAAVNAPQNPSAQSEPANPSGKPTTQELLTGQYVKLALPGMPVSLRVPVSWKFDSAGVLVLLAGPAPSGHDAVIQLATRDQLPADRFDPIIDRLKKETEDEPGPIKRVDLHSVGTLRVFERIYSSKPISTPRLDFRGNTVIDEKGDAVMETSTPLHWTISVFQPEGAVYNRFELNVIGLTTEQYAFDKEMLEKVIRSLAYESTPGTNPAPLP